MPLDNQEMPGSEKDGSKNLEYCKYCYQDGAFINPNMSLKEMKSLVKQQMKNRSIAQDTIDLAVNSLPHLKRWRSKVHIS